jgi:hypothetical protein
LQRNGNSNRHARAEELDFQGVFEGKARRMLKKSATGECAIKIQAGVSNDVAAGAGPFSRETATYRCMHLPHAGTAPWLAPRRRPATATKVSCLRSRLSRLFDQHRWPVRGGFSKKGASAREQAQPAENPRTRSAKLQLSSGKLIGNCAAAALPLHNSNAR